MALTEELYVGRPILKTKMRWSLYRRTMLGACSAMTTWSLNWSNELRRESEATRKFWQIGPQRLLNDNWRMSSGTVSKRSCKWRATQLWKRNWHTQRNTEAETTQTESSLSKSNRWHRTMQNMSVPEWQCRWSKKWWRLIKKCLVCCSWFYDSGANGIRPYGHWG